MDQEIQDKYDEAKAFLNEMIDVFQDDVQFKRKYSAFLAAADSTLEYIKNNYEDKINSNGEKFNKWFSSSSSPRWGAELTHLTRARGHNIHFGYIPTGATRSASYGVTARIITEEQATKERESRSNHDERKKDVLEDIPSENSHVKTLDRWLVDEHKYMKYKKYDNNYLIPIIQSQYPAKSIEYPSGNRADVIRLSMAYLVKIKSIIDNCQRKWP